VFTNGTIDNNVRAAVDLSKCFWNMAIKRFSSKRFWNMAIKRFLDDGDKFVPKDHIPTLLARVLPPPDSQQSQPEHQTYTHVCRETI